MFFSVALMRADPNCDLDEQGKAYCFLNGKRPDYMDEVDDLDDERMFECKFEFFLCFS